MAYVDTLNKNSTDYALSAFGNVFINNQNSNTAKTIDYSNRGFSENDDVNLTVKIVFQNGHTSADTLTNMTLNGKAILVNKNGTLTPIPIQTLTEGGVTVYRTLQANTTLEMYYTKSVSGYTNGAYVVIGNPVVISTANYTIYADGYFEGEKQYPVGSIYQNKINSTNPNSLFGFGAWTQITDKFLACRGSQLTEGSGAIVGNFSYTLSEANIPAHTHGMGGANMDMTSGELANISNATFNHYHSIDATHDHSITDNGHYHTIGNQPEVPQSSQLVMPVGTGGNNGINILWGQNASNLVYAQYNQTGISVNSKTLIFNSGYQNADSQIVINQGVHVHYLKSYGLLNPTSINTTPPYQAVYTWYRDS